MFLQFLPSLPPSGTLPFAKSIHCLHPDLPRVPVCPPISVDYAGARTAADYEEILP